MSGFIITTLCQTLPISWFADFTLLKSLLSMVGLSHFCPLMLCRCWIMRSWQYTTSCAGCYSLQTASRHALLLSAEPGRPSTTWPSIAVQPTSVLPSGTLTVPQAPAPLGACAEAISCPQDTPLAAQADSHALRNPWREALSWALRKLGDAPDPLLPWLAQDMAGIAPLLPHNTREERSAFLEKVLPKQNALVQPRDLQPPPLQYRCLFQEPHHMP